MKCLLCIWALVLGLPLNVSAFLSPPGVQFYFPRADSVYVARVTSVDGEKVFFAVTETLRGNPAQILTLKPMERERRYYVPKSEWLLVSISPKPTGPEDIVCMWVPEMVAWVARSVTRTNGKVYVHDYETQFENRPPEGTEYMTLDRIKQLLIERPYKP
jgi:hypothetical protein